MDFRELLGKLDSLNEAISLQSVEAAVAGKSNEQDRAKILMGLAQQNGLPGLYDPVTGYFVSAMPDTSNWPEQKARISATAAKDDDKKLAAAGLIPKNANTSTWLGKAFGSSGDEYDKELRTASGKAAADAASAAAQAKIPKLVARGKQLLLKLATEFKQSQATASAPAAGTAPAAAAPAAGASAQKKTRTVKDANGKTWTVVDEGTNLAKSLVESFGYLYEGDQETLDKIMARLADLDPDNKDAGHAELSQLYSDFMNLKNAPAKPAEQPATPAAADTNTPAAGAAGQKRNYGVGVLGPGSVGPEVEALQKRLGFTGKDIDGKYGKDTKAAVEAIQKALGVTVDGLYGPETKGAWDKNPNAKAGSAGASAQATDTASGDVAALAAKAYPNATGGEEYWVNGVRYQYLRTRGLANPGEWKPNFKAGDWGWSYNKWAAENKFTGTPKEAKAAYDKDSLTKKSAAAEPGGPGDMGQAAPNAPKAPGSVEPAPVNPKQRAEWARKYGATHNTDGSPKSAEQKPPTSESKELDDILKLTGL